MDSLNLQDRTGEKTLVMRRAFVALILILILTLALLWRLFFLQVVQHDVYATKSLSNRVQVQPIPPTRGLIYDRNGNLLAENLPSHQLTLVIERVDNLDETLAFLRELVDISEREEKRFRDRLKRYHRPFEPIAIKYQLTEDEIARLAVNTYFLDGVEVQASLIRQYPYGDTFAHVLGYVGRISEQELRKLDTGTYAGTGYIGKEGIEKTYESTLLGQPGYQTVETNARGRILQVLEKEAPQPGKNLQLYLDLELQQLAQQQLEGKRGAIVAMDPKTGGLLAMVSNPGFDPNLFVTGISNEEYGVLRDSRDVPFLNRATRGLYPPASTVKPFLGLGALAEGVTNWEYQVPDPGFYILPTDESIRKRDWKEEGHGDFVALSQAVIESCDIYFYDLAFRMKLEAMHSTLDSFGFGRNTTLDVYNAKPGINPTRDWKKARHGFSWFAGDSVNIGIGQGYLNASPLQVTIAMNVLVNEGEWKVPRLLMPTPALQELEQELELPPQLQLDDAHWKKMKQALKDVLHSVKGTARGTGYQSSFQMAGKTGTAQVFSLAQDEEYDAEEVQERLKDHAWFTGYAPYDDPQIVVTVFVENGEHGSWAAPIARALFENWINRNNNKIQ